MPKVETIGMPQSTFVRVVRMVCEEKGIDYELTRRCREPRWGEFISKT